MRRVAIRLGYDGTAFGGSQVQPGQRTVQGELNAALQRLAPGSSGTIFAGRTDRGVHAVGQVASVDTSWCQSDRRLRDALNAIAPSDLSILDVRTVADDFHARFNALEREYRYRIVVSDVPPVLDRRFVWWRWAPIDAAAADSASRRLVGTRAFGSFAGSGRSAREPAEQLTRTVKGAEWHEISDGCHEFVVTANGFLPQMVRNMVAALVEIGSGKRPVDWIDELLAANDRTRIGQAAPPQGLVLWRVSYPEEAEPADISELAQMGRDEGYGEE